MGCCVMGYIPNIWHKVSHSEEEEEIPSQQVSRDRRETEERSEERAEIGKEE